jgi:hypothetical protein
VSEVGDELVTVEDLRPHRNPKQRVLAARAVREPSAAGSTAASAQRLVRPEARKVTPPCIRDEHDVATVTAVASVRAAARHVLLAAEVDRAVAPSARDGRQPRSVVEHRAYGNGK